MNGGDENLLAVTFDEIAFEELGHVLNTKSVEGSDGVFCTLKGELWSVNWLNVSMGRCWSR